MARRNFSDEDMALIHAKFRQLTPEERTNFLTELAVIGLEGWLKHDTWRREDRRCVKELIASVRQYHEDRDPQVAALVDQCEARLSEKRHKALDPLIWGEVIAGL